MPVHSRRATVVEIGGLLAFFAAAVAFIRPAGDFPLNDDGYYALPAFHFARTGEFLLTIAPASVRAQVLWGALWVRLFGASYDVLRASVLVLAAATVILVNRILARAAIPGALRVMASLAFAVAPLFLWSATTFMTEVPFVFASVLAFALYLRGLEEDSVGLLAAGAAATALSWWVRQTGIINAIPPLVILLWHRQKLSRHWLRDALVCAVPIVVFGAIYRMRPSWLMGWSPEFSGLYHMWSEATFRLPQQAALVYHYFLYTAQSMALTFLPLVVGAAFGIGRASRTQKVVLLAAVIVTTAGMASLVAHGSPFPYYGGHLCCDLLQGDIFMNFGLGQPTLADVWGGAFPYPFHITRGASVFLTFASGLAAAVLVWAIALRARPESAQPRPSVLGPLAATHALLGTAALCASSVWFDRYALDAAWSVALVLPLAIPWEMRSARIATTATLCAVVLFSLLSINEYFAWNRARWNAYYALRNSGVALKDIDGGAEAYNMFELAYVKDIHKRRRMGFGPGKRRYVIAFHQTPRTRVVARYPFSGWLGWHRGVIFALENQ